MQNLKLGLTPEQVAKRYKSIGGSDANTLMSGNDEWIYNLWLEKTRQKEPDDLSRVLPVQMGSYTEPFNCDWYEKETGHEVFDTGKEVVCKVDPWRTATLDGLVNIGGTCCVWEAKHVNAFSKMDDVVQSYMPQLHHNMSCAGYHVAILSVLKGTQEYAYFDVEEDELYSIALLEREREFWECVQTKTPPKGMEAIKAPAIGELVEVDMTGNNEWASHAADWLETQPAVKRFKEAEKNIKTLTADNASLAYGHGVKVKRAKNNSLRISKHD